MVYIYSKYIDDVIASPIISAFSKDEIQTFLKTGKFKVVRYKTDTTIHFDGEPCEKLEIIISGKVVIDRIDSSGDLFTITEFSKGDILGGNIMFSSNPFYLMTVTTTDECVILEISKDLLFELLSTNKQFLKAYLEFVSNLTTILGNKIKYHIKQSLRDSIVNYLKQEHRKQNTLKIKLSITKKMLAEHLGVQRTSLSRELKKMENDKLIIFDSNSITVTDENILNI